MTLTRRPADPHPGGPTRLWAGQAHRGPVAHWSASTVTSRSGPGAHAPVTASATSRRLRADRGSATAELAAGLPVVVLLLLFGLTAVAAVTTRVQCVDAAREAARVAARGGDGLAAGRESAPGGAEVSVVHQADTVVATVRSPVPLLGARLPGLVVTASAVAAAEPGSPGPAW